MIKLFDSHAHYDDERYSNGDSTPYIVLEEMFADNVQYILGASVDLQSAKRQVEFSKQFEGFYASVGIHPESCPDISLIDETIKQLSALADNEKVCAIGEIGLDYYWEENPPKDVQKAWFEAQLQLAQKKNLPVIVHDREAHGDCLEILKEERITRGVMHCFSGSVEFMREVTRLGLHVALGGVVTYKNARHTVDVAAEVPLDKLLLETDCPYLSPVPNRGKRNSSLNLVYTAERIAEIRGIDVGTLAVLTTKNTKRLFGIA